MAAFCSKCGAQLEGNERFCVKCGNDVSAQAAAPAAASAPAAAPPAAVPVAPAVAPPPPGYAAPPPPGYAAPGPIPVMGVPPPVQPQKKSGMMWGVIAIAVLLGVWYYYHNNQQTQTPPANAPTQPGTAPTQPGGAPGQPGGEPGQAPGQGQAPGAPGGGQGGGNNAALVNLQVFSGRWVPYNGYIEVSNARWTNHSNVTIQSATLECVQYAANGSAITQMSTILNGPTGPGTTSTFGPFPMGAIQASMSRVNCGIVGVNPAS